MVGHERAPRTGGREIVFATYVELDVEKLEAMLQEGQPHLVAMLAQEDVEFVLMDNALEIIDNKLRHILAVVRCFVANDLVDIYQEC